MKRGAIRKVGATLGLLAFIAVVAEIVLRLAWPQIFPIYERGMLSPDPDIGHVLTPNFEGHLERVDFRVDVHINEQGFRGPALPRKRESTIRILCLGDYTTFGWGVTVDEAYPAVVERMLRDQNAGLDIEVINAGVPFFATIDELAYLKRRLSEFQPDIVITLFNAVDDFEQNLAPAHERQEFEDGILRYKSDYEWQRNPAWLTVLNRVKHYSHVVRLLSETAGQALMRADMLAEIEGVSSQFFSDEQGRTAQTLLTDISLLAKENGARTVIVFAPEKMQVLAKPTEELRAARLIRTIAEEAGTGYVDITSAALQQDNVEELFSAAEGYWTARSHEMIAAEIAQEILQKDLLAPTE